MTVVRLHGNTDTLAMTLSSLIEPLLRMRGLRYKRTSTEAKLTRARCAEGPVVAGLMGNMVNYQHQPGWENTRSGSQQKWDREEPTRGSTKRRNTLHNVCVWSVLLALAQSEFQYISLFKTSYTFVGNAALFKFTTTIPRSLLCDRTSLRHIRVNPLRADRSE